MNTTSKLVHISSFFKVIIFLLCFSLYNYFGSISVDLNNYKEVYEKEWYQFEPIFNLIMFIFYQAHASFFVFWLFLGVIISLLMANIYSERTIFFLALPNIIYLLSNSFSVQLRFAVASLFLVYFFKNRRSFFSKLFIFFTPLLHTSIALPLLMILFLDKGVDDNKSVFTFKNLIFFTSVIIGSFVFLLLLNNVLTYFHYDHYIDSKFLVDKSMSSILYMISMSLVLLLVNYKDENKTVVKYRDFAYLGLAILLVSIVSQELSVISGRLFNLYFVIEPFIMCYIFYKVERNTIGWFFIFIVTLIYLSKFIPMVI
ncbi:EpsG family protein [Vibrio cyclitrophicus]|uniref:EpsG family protein n=1 Tax=Vibrio cyclitrophicus TaxID=47951 RepID=UPI0039997ADA